MFKLQTWTGTYSKAECLSEDNLITNMMLQPEIMEDIIFSSQGYTISFLTHGLGQYGGDRIKALDIRQRSFEWAVMGRVHKAVTFVRHVSGTGASDGEIVAVCSTDWLNPRDVIKLDNGQQLWTIAKGAKVADGYQFRFKLIAVSATDTLNTAFVGFNKRGGVIGNKHTNGSKKGYGNTVYPDRFKQWSTISRAGISWDNEGILSVVWFKNPVNGKKMWCFEQQKQILDKVLWEMEQDKWFGRMTTVDGGETWMKDPDSGKDVVAGAGYIQQVGGSNSDTYVPGVDDVVTKFKERIGELILKGSGLTYRQIAAHTGAVHGYEVWHTAMEKDFMKGFKTLFYSATAGKMIEVGEEYKSYTFNHHDVIPMGNMLFEDQEIHTNRTFGSAPKEAYNFFFMPIAANGNGNVCAINRKSIDGKNDRSFVMKRFPGMIDIEGHFKDENNATTSEDSYGEEYLFEHGVAVFSPSMSAELIATST